MTTNTSYPFKDNNSKDIVTRIRQKIQSNMYACPGVTDYEKQYISIMKNVIDLIDEEIIKETSKISKKGCD